MIQLSGQQLIGGVFKASGRETFAAFNPAAAKALEQQFTEATLEEIDEACLAAAGAFADYQGKSGRERAAFLERIADEIVNLGDDLVQAAGEETGLPAARLQGERTRTVNQLRLFAGLIKEGSWVNAVIDTAQPDRQPLPKPDIRQMQVPLGPVAVFGASNFPFAFSVAGSDTASALAAGCPVVFKAHPAHPASCELMAIAIAKAGKECNMPAGVFNMVQGGSHQVGGRLVQHPAIKAVGFTGSFAGGKALYDLAVRRPEPIPVYAEMGSVNPVFFLPRVLKEKGTALAKSFAASVTLGTGQFCTNPGTFALMDGEEAQAFLQQTKEALLQISMGPMLTQGIQASYLKGVQELAKHTGETITAENVQAFVFTTRMKDALQNDHLMEEVFGPCSVGIRADSKEELMQFARSLKGQLTATIHGTEEDLAEYRELVSVLQQKAGRLVINGFPTGVEVSHAMVHGGPFPATTDSRSTSVGTLAIYRFSRPVCLQDFPQSLLPEELKDENPLGIWRKMNGEWSR